MPSENDKLIKGDQLDATVQRLENEMNALMKEAQETKTTPLELSKKTAEYQEAYEQQQAYRQDELSRDQDFDS